MPIVLDTNVLVSALISNAGPPALLYEAWVRGDFELATSAPQIAELARVLRYERLRPYINPIDAETLCDTIDAAALLIDALPEVRITADPDDNMIVATAIAAGAALIASGDKAHLLELGSVQGISIVTPRAAMVILAERQTMTPEEPEG